jgi:hypothetical protein
MLESSSHTIDFRDLEDDECAMKLYNRFRSYSLPGCSNFEGSLFEIGNRFATVNYEARIKFHLN